MQAVRNSSIPPDLIGSSPGGRGSKLILPADVLDALDEPLDFDDDEDDADSAVGTEQRLGIADPSTPRTGREDDRWRLGQRRRRSFPAPPAPKPPPGSAGREPIIASASDEPRIRRSRVAVVARPPSRRSHRPSRRTVQGLCGVICRHGASFDPEARACAQPPA